MALGDIRLSAVIQFAKLGRQLSIGDSGKPINVIGKEASAGTLTVTTGDDTFPLGDVSTIGMVGFRNCGGTLIVPATAPTITNAGTPGAQTMTYAILARQKDGGYNVASGDGTTATGNDTLDTSNYNIVSWAAVENATSYDVYRTSTDGTTPSTTGLIGSTAASTLTLNDTGLTGDGTTAPSTTPYDFDVEIGEDGANYPILLKGGDQHVTRWQSAAIHVKALTNNTDVQFLIVSE